MDMTPMYGTIYGIHNYFFPLLKSLLKTLHLPATTIVAMTTSIPPADIATYMYKGCCLS
jgi:hypothetical protein